MNTTLQQLEKRKIVPIVACISAGKSMFLNVILNIKSLESKADIGTKFVNIIRYNPSLKEPRFSHLKVKKVNQSFVFYLDTSYAPINGEQKITEVNKRINKEMSGKSSVDYDDIFYLLEINEAKLLRDKEYLKTHDLCDIPGLSEQLETEEEVNGATESKQDEQIEEKKDNKIVMFQSQINQIGEGGLCTESDSERNENCFTQNILLDKDKHTELYI